MKSGEARLLLGFSPNSHPTPSQGRGELSLWLQSHGKCKPMSVTNWPCKTRKVKAAYKRKVWDVHPDRVPIDKRSYAESQFKMISEAYNCLLSGGGRSSSSATYTRVVRTGVPRVHGGGRQHVLVGLPFLFIIFGTVGLGGLNASRAYRKEKEANPSLNPFLP